MDARSRADHLVVDAVQSADRRGHRSDGAESSSDMEGPAISSVRRFSAATRTSDT
jgi:hypothetical protein